MLSPALAVRKWRVPYVLICIARQNLAAHSDDGSVGRIGITTKSYHIVQVIPSYTISFSSILPPVPVHCNQITIIKEYKDHRSMLHMSFVQHRNQLALYSASQKVSECGSAFCHTSTERAQSQQHDSEGHWQSVVVPSFSECVSATKSSHPLSFSLARCLLTPATVNPKDHETNMTVFHKVFCLSVYLLRFQQILNSYAACNNGNDNSIHIT